MSLRNQLTNAKIDSEELDDLVYAAAERIASRVNNEGMQEQLEFLSQAGFSDAEILEELDVSTRHPLNNVYHGKQNTVTVNGEPLALCLDVVDHIP